MRTTLKIQGLTIVESSGGPLHVEYALFDPEERELGRSAGRVVESGFRTTARAARARLAQMGLTTELAASVAKRMVPGLAQAFARGGPARRVVALLDPAVLFESTRYDASAAVYGGTFLDLEALEGELGRRGVTAAFQALSLAAQLARLEDGARLELDTLEHAAGLKPGAHTYARVTLPALPDLPGLLAELTGRGGGRGATGAALGQAKLLDLLRARLHGGPKLDACVKAIDAAREPPTTGALAQAELWEIELLLDAGNFAAASQKLLMLERKSGRVPVTAYLRARHELLTGGASPEALARRLVTAAQSAGAFPELVLLAAEASLAASQEGRARELARRALDEGLPALMRERAAMLLQRCGTASPEGASRREEPRAERPPPARRAVIDPRAEDDSPPATERVAGRPVAHARPANPSPAPPATSRPPPGPARPASPPAAPAPSRPPAAPAAPSPPPAAPATSRPPPDVAARRPLELEPEVTSRPALPPRAVDPVFSLETPPGVFSPEPRPALPPDPPEPRPALPPDAPAARPLTLSVPDLAIPRPSGEHDVATARPVNLIDQFQAPTAPPPAPPTPRSSPPGQPARSSPSERPAPTPRTSPPARLHLTVPAAAQVQGARGRETPTGVRVPIVAESERPPRDDGELPGSLPPPPPSPTRPQRLLDSGHPTIAAPTSAPSDDATGASLPLTARDVAPPWFGHAPALPGGDPRGAEAAEELPLPLPAGLSGATLRVEHPRTVLEARIQFTFLSRELGRLYRAARLVTLRADLSGIEHMQTYLGERFPSGEVDAAGLAEVRLHGAFLSEILARRLGGQWIDLRSPHVGHWEMMVAPGTRVWPFGRVARYIARAHRERDLVAYFLELQTHALLAARG